MLTLRTLTDQDAEAFHTLRVRALVEHPEAFGMDAATQQQKSLETVARELAASSKESYWLGAFDKTELVGMLMFARYHGSKLRHRAILGGMYVLPEARKHGVGRALLTETINRAKQLTDLEAIILAVTVGNELAKRLYLSLGFKPMMLDLRFIKVGQTFYDIEWMMLQLSRKQT
jgi:ribosomal protein S18 acetylase RimI-like enzyme